MWKAQISYKIYGKKTLMQSKIKDGDLLEAYSVD